MDENNSSEAGKEHTFFSLKRHPSWRWCDWNTTLQPDEKRRAIRCSSSANEDSNKQVQNRRGKHLSQLNLIIKRSESYIIVG